MLPFGLTNAPAVFLNLMKAVFRHFLSDFTGVYLDDILVCNKSYKYHLKHLKQAVDKLPEHKSYAKTPPTSTLAIKILLVACSPSPPTTYPRKLKSTTS